MPLGLTKLIVSLLACLVLLGLSTSVPGQVSAQSQTSSSTEWTGSVDIHKGYAQGFSYPPGYGSSQVAGVSIGEERWQGSFDLAVLRNTVVAGSASGAGAISGEMRYDPGTHCLADGVTCLSRCTWQGDLPSTLSVQGEILADGSAYIGFNTPPNLVFPEICYLNNGGNYTGSTQSFLFGGAVTGIVIQVGASKTSTVGLDSTTVIIGAEKSRNSLSLTINKLLDACVKNPWGSGCWFVEITWLGIVFTVIGVWFMGKAYSRRIKGRIPRWPGVSSP